VIFQPVEVHLPELAVSREPVIELDQRLRADAVKAPLGVLPNLHDAGLLEGPKVLRNGGLAEAEVPNELPHRSLSLPEEVEDRLPARFGQDLKGCERGDSSNMPEQLYSCQGMKAATVGDRGACGSKIWPPGSPSRALPP
jgi:hypothetical protein